MSDTYEGDKLGRIIAADRNAKAAIIQTQQASQKLTDLKTRVAQLEQLVIQLQDRDNQLQVQIVAQIGNGSTNGQ